MQAIILAGGLGTRLRSVVPHLPKPMAHVNEEPFLAALLRYAYAQGVDEVVLCLHHQADVVRAYFGTRFAGVNIQYSVEETPLGTGGAIRKALTMVDHGKPVFVLNGDSLVMLNYKEMLAWHHLYGAKVTLAATHMASTERYSRLAVRDHRAMGYELHGDAQGGDISVGFYVLQPDVFAGYAPPEIFSLERDFLAAHVPQLQPAVFTRVEYFIDIGVPDDYVRAQREIPQKLSAA